MAKSRTPDEIEDVEREVYAEAEDTDAVYAEAEDSGIKRRVGALAVDDDEIVRAALVRLLSTCSIHALEADSGPRALDLLQLKDIDMIICDQSMPSMTGIDVLRVARFRFPRVRRVLFTGHRDVTLFIEAVDQCGVDFVLDKGASTAELSAKLSYLREGIELVRAKDVSSRHKGCGSKK